jgi:uncharacterized protein
VNGSDRLDGLVEEALERATMPNAYFHGQRHWRRVARIGLWLRDPVTEADPLVLFLFALFHDSMRKNEDKDPGHGIRGRILGEELIPNHLGISDAQQAAFKEACDHHTDGKLSEDPSIAVCWDADRLDLWRVGKEPSPRFMSTPVAAKESTIEWTGSIVGVEPPSWKELAQQAAGASSISGSTEPRVET